MIVANDLRFVEPKFTVSAKLPLEVCNNVKVGQAVMDEEDCYLRLPGAEFLSLLDISVSETVGEYLYPVDLKISI